MFFDTFVQNKLKIDKKFWKLILNCFLNLKRPLDVAFPHFFEFLLIFELHAK